MERDGARKYKRKAGADGEGEVVLWPRWKLVNKVGLPVIFDHYTLLICYSEQQGFCVTRAGHHNPYYHGTTF